MNTFGVATVRAESLVCYSVCVRLGSLWFTSALAVLTFWSRLTLPCEVRVPGQSWPRRLLVPQNSTIMFNCTTNLPTPHWSIRLPDRNDLFTDVAGHTMTLHENGVYQLNTMSGTLRLKINQTADNNQTVIRCLSTPTRVIVETKLFVYEPISLTLDKTDGNMLKSSYISWNSLPLFGDADTNQTFELTVVGSNTREKTYHEIREPNFIFQAPEGAPQCEIYNFTVTGAHVGASYTGTDCSLPSPVLSTMLPSLPNVSSTESSLDYMLQKIPTMGFELRVSFLPATYCESYPITSYTLEVQGTDMIHKSQTSLTSISNISVDNLVDNNVYNFSIIVSNDAGNSSTSKRTFYTTDVQVVRAVQLEDDSTLMLQCLFVNGSDAIGCLVVLQLMGEANITTELLLNEGMDMCVMKVVNLTKPTADIREIFGYDIESNGSIGTLTVHGELMDSSFVSCGSSGDFKDKYPSTLIIIVPAVIGAIIISLLLLVVFCFACRRVSATRRSSEKPLMDPPISSALVQDEVEPNSRKSEQNIGLDDLPTQKQNAVGRSCGDGATDCNYYSTIQHQWESPCPDISDNNAGYAELGDNKEHFYHVLECNRPPKGREVILPDPDAPELPPPFKEELPVPPPIYHDINDLPSRGAALRQNDYTDHTLTSK